MQHLDDPDVVVVDATVRPPGAARSARADHEAGHIPGARFCDLDQVSDPGNPRPRKIPDRAHFLNEIGKLGIETGKYVVVYDTLGLFSAARLWWMLRHFGHDRVAVLDGGMLAWRQAGGPVEAGIVTPLPVNFEPGATRNLLALWPDVLEASQAGRQILDARTPGRWAGTEGEAAAGARAGHIPNSRNLCWSEILHAETRALLPAADLRRRFEAAGLSLDHPVELSCGSGMTACILALGLFSIGHENWRVYDGSWEEWSQMPDLPVAQSGAPG
jgi:thiosulfate/3-mercaptopyruvate sulfurtransferase